MARDDGIDIPLLRRGAELLLEYGRLEPGSEGHVLKAIEMLGRSNLGTVQAKGACTRISLAQYRLPQDMPEDDRKALLEAMAHAGSNQLPRG